MLLKIEEVIALSLENKVDMILCGGDITDSPHASNLIVDDLIDRVEKAGISWYCIAGNHDILNRNWEMSKTTALAHIFRRSKMFKLLDNYEDDTCVIKGLSYFHGIEESLKTGGFQVKESKKWKVGLSHSFITLKPFFQNVPHVIAKDLLTNCDVILCSHLHENWGIKDINGVQFVNPGSLGRTSIKEQHLPTIATGDTITRKIDIIPLKSAKAASEAFDLTKYEENKAKEIDISSFLESMQNINLQEMDFQNQLLHIGKENKSEKEVLDYLIDVANKVKE
jgi:DNA repair exonuclease SbcCD nuclease subunit